MFSDYKTPVKMGEEELKSRVIEYIMSTNAYAVDKNDLVAKILAKTTNKKERN